jgi:leader peptidase (prepilin peptidase)/N-methyltransferase
MAEYLALLQAEFPALIFFVASMFGLIIGSFLNVVVYRIPIMLERDWKQQAHDILGSSTIADVDKFNLAFPDSHCPSCDHKIRVWENIPLLSYAYLRGKCSACGIHISARYPLLEFATGILTAVVILEFGVTPLGLSACVLTWGLMALALIDYDTQLLPDDITLPLLWLGLAVNYFGVMTYLADAFVGACAGYLALWTVFQLFKLITGKDGMGYGDFKLLSLLGAWLGWQALPLIIILSSFGGALIGGSLILMGRARDNPIPFGPYLAIAGWITLIWGEKITLAYLQFTAF